ncbi:2,3-bisphosphoglycerate-independent phosphoglycerate mutase [Thermoproteota archaeon]
MSEQLHLDRLSSFSGRPGPLLFIIMDGIGIGKPGPGNAFLNARTPNLDQAMKRPLYTLLNAHGTAVGLPSNSDMGNSEVGHNAMGAGRVFSQGAKLVNEAIESGAIFQGHTWKKMMDHCLKHHSKLHFIGLLSDGNVHSHINHLIKMIEQAAMQGVKEVCVHTLLDGRDVGERSAPDYLEKLEIVLADINQKEGVWYRIASGGGRMVTTMDRYNADWAIVERGWNAHVHGIGRGFKSAGEAVQTFYQEDPKLTDQYLPPFVVYDNDEPAGKIADKDCVILFNFRGDRAIEITQAFEAEKCDHFDRGRVPDVMYGGMMEYDGDLQIPKHYLVEPPSIDNTLGEYLCAEHVSSFAISETQKFGHVTYFWNGNKSGYIDKDYETYIEIPSDRVEFDKKPEMKASEITDKTIALLQTGTYKFGRVNFPNGDMVGHTGVYDAAVKACETVDTCIGRLIPVVNALNGITIITADHGNVEDMMHASDKGNVVVTAHSLNPVPFIILDPLYNNDYKLADLADPGVANIAATICNLLGFNKPADYEPSLLTF